MRSFKNVLTLGLLAGALSVGFLGGRRLHQMVPARASSHNRSLLLSAMAGEGMGRSDAFGQDTDAAPADIFETVLDHVQRDYVEGVNSNAQLSNSALARMFASLDDPKTYFLEPSLRQAQQDALSGRFHGIGAVLTTVKSKKADVEYRHLAVVAVMPGSPAEKAGLKSGDRITEVDGHWIIAYSILVDADRIAKSSKDDAAKREEFKPIAERFKQGYSLDKAVKALDTGEGKTLKLTVERGPQSTPLKTDVTTAITQVDPVEFRMQNKVGYLRIRQFNAKATDAFQTALNGLNGAKGLIVDLRGNPGGVRAEPHSAANGYDSAIKLIGRLTRGGAIATIERKAARREPLTVTPGSTPVNLPMVVLVDEGTANLSELVASALRDTSKAKVIGAHTFGDPILQSFTVLKDGAGVAMATGKMLTASGVDLAQGVTPDIPVASGSKTPDAALERALKALGA